MNFNFFSFLFNLLSQSFFLFHMNTFVCKQHIHWILIFRLQTICAWFFIYAIFKIHEKQKNEDFFSIIRMTLNFERRKNFICQYFYFSNVKINLIEFFDVISWIQNQINHFFNRVKFRWIVHQQNYAYISSLNCVQIVAMIYAKFDSFVQSTFRCETFSMKLIY